jgi:phage shock protein A
MAGTWQRIKGIFQAKANKALDKAEDPRHARSVLRAATAAAQKIRRSVIDMATARKAHRAAGPGPAKASRQTQGQAKAALQQSNEDLARVAGRPGRAVGDLKVSMTRSSSRSRSWWTQLHPGGAVPHQKETLKASYTAAEATTKVNEAVSGISDSSSGRNGQQRAQDKIAGMQARAGARSSSPRGHQRSLRRSTTFKKSSTR